MKNKLIILSFLSLVIYSCSKLNSNDEVKPKEIDFTVYKYGVDIRNDHMTTLGKFLFYDKNLSINNSMSCGSCHIQELGFADGLQKSIGFAGEETVFHSMALSNLSQNERFFWDGRSLGINNTVLLPISDHVEMGLDDVELLISKIESIPYYQDLFRNAFGHTVISQQRISSALSTFVLSLKSNNSKNQKVIRGEDYFFPSEHRGRELFFGKYNCGNCHNVDQLPHGTIWGGGFNHINFLNIGLDRNPSNWGQKSKIPNLANIGVTAPYMHDGRFKTLEEVIDHYSGGVQDNPNLSSFLRNPNGTPLRQNIPPQDKQDLIAFLHTLTDHEFLNDIRYSNPFN